MAFNIPADAGWMLDEYDGQRFWDSVNFRGGHAYREDPLVDQSRVKGHCWIWFRRKDPKSYGRFRIGERWFQSHRVAYMDFGNTIADGLVLDHLCRTTRCVHPTHVEPVEVRENVLRGAQYLPNRTRCNNGHKLTAETIMDRGRGKLACRTCYKAWSRNQDPALVD